MSGEGAFRFGGRWNSPGRHCIYASGNFSLAVLEVLVHLDDAEFLAEPSHVYHSLGFPSTGLRVMEQRDLPNGWNVRPVSNASQIAGDEWLDSLSGPVLAVPSVFMPQALRYEPHNMNYLVNPLHPLFVSTVEVGEVREVAFDDRLASRR